MSKAFLDTTIVADALLKRGEQHNNAVNALARYDEILLPVYAIKEFKRGPLRAYIWLHNKVITTGSWGNAVECIASIHTHKNLSSTAIKAVADFTSALEAPEGEDFSGLRSSSGGTFLQKQARIWLKTKIFGAWRKLNQRPFQKTQNLDCYALVAPKQKSSGIIDRGPYKCTLGNCCVQMQLLDDQEALKALEKICKGSEKQEMLKRAKVLRHIRRHPNSNIEENKCVTLGDLVFALQCPEGAVILTTNIVDHEPLSNALGKQAVLP